METITNSRHHRLITKLRRVDIAKSVAATGARKHRNLWLYSQEVFQKSSLSGISQIAESRTWCRRILWLALFLACMFGFIYHATMYFSFYAAYPTTVDVRVENKGQMEFPGVTLCNNNRLRKSLYCQEYYCADNEMQDHDEYWRMNKSERIRLGHTKQQTIVGCKLNGRVDMDEEQCYKRFRLYYSAEHGNCFTFNALWNMADHKMLQAYESDMWNKPTELLLDLDVKAEEYLDDHKTPSILIYVHDPWFYPDFGSEAVKARVGHFYSVGMRKIQHISSLEWRENVSVQVQRLCNVTFNQCFISVKTTTKLLPLPYQTNCTTYSSMPWAQRNKGVLTPKMCTQECSRSLQLKACKCISSNLTLVFDDSSCEGKKASCAEDAEKNTTDYCRTLCRVPCVRKTFEAAVDSSAWPRKRQMVNSPKWEDRDLSEIRKNLVRVKLYLRTFEVTMYEHWPKYELVEVFSHLGGYLSLWLGFSVLAFCELLEMVSMVALRITDVKTSTVNTITPKRIRRIRTRRRRNSYETY